MFNVQCVLSLRFLTSNVTSSVHPMGKYSISRWSVRPVHVQYANTAFAVLPPCPPAVGARAAVVRGLKLAQSLMGANWVKATGRFAHGAFGRLAGGVRLRDMGRATGNRHGHGMSHGR